MEMIEDTLLKAERDRVEKQTELIGDLLSRIEKQAVEIAELKKERDFLKARVESIPMLVTNAIQNEWRSMAKAAYNCGPSSGCSLARRRLDSSQ
jgi:hypothetical protein